MPSRPPVKDLTRVGRSSLAGWDALAPPALPPLFVSGDRAPTRTTDGAPFEQAEKSPCLHRLVDDETAIACAWQSSSLAHSHENGFDRRDSLLPSTPPLPSSPRHGQQPGNRFVSCATIIDHGSPPRSPAYDGSVFQLPSPPRTASLPPLAPTIPTLVLPIDEQREPTRSSFRRAPSPVVLEHHRHEPYQLTVATTSRTKPPIPQDEPPGQARSDQFRNVDQALLNELVTAPSQLPPNTTSSLTRSEPAHTRKFSANHVRRPRNSFILFRTHLNSKVDLFQMFSLGRQHATAASKVVGQLWSSLTREERRGWDKLAELEKKRHQEEFPEYKYRPKAKTSEREKPKKKKKKESTTSIPRSERTSSIRKARGSKRLHSEETDSDEDGQDCVEMGASDSEFSEYRTTMKDERFQRVTRSQGKASSDQDVQTPRAFDTPEPSSTTMPSKSTRTPTRTPTSSTRKSKRLGPYSSPLSDLSSVLKSSQRSPTETDSLESSPTRCPSLVFTQQPLSPLSSSTSGPKRSHKTYGSLSDAAVRRPRPQPVPSVNASCIRPSLWVTSSVSERSIQQDAARLRGVTPSILDPLELVQSRFEYDNSLLVPDYIAAGESAANASFVGGTNDPTRVGQVSRISSIGSRWYQQKTNGRAPESVTSDHKTQIDAWMSPDRLVTSLADVTQHPASSHVRSSELDVVEFETFFDFEAAVKDHPQESYHVGQRDLFVNPTDVFGPLKGVRDENM
ncbi:hypothetical protein OIV83_000648 [Microbotryomycetes sp. JL201]|nr:hypothetical protein OIV83_000648 [Microbotryomycetes sp. JL201]